MITIALIGGDGSGKSTLANKLLEEFSLPMKYIYMGANIESSNYTLPWSKMALRLKLLFIKRKATKQNIVDPTFLNTHHMAHRQRPSSLPRTIFRLLNRLSEVAYRNLISFLLQFRGNHVIYDRHFLFDTTTTSNKNKSRIDKVNDLYYWILRHIFPIPDLIIFLHASPEVMVARKEEATVEYLEQRNMTWLRQGKTFNNFICIDANQSPQQVYKDTVAVILHYYHHNQITHPNSIEAQQK